MKKDVIRPAEHKALFSGTNTDDHFCLGIKVTRGAVRCVTTGDPVFLVIFGIASLQHLVGMLQHSHNRYESAT